MAELVKSGEIRSSNRVHLLDPGAEPQDFFFSCRWPDDLQSDWKALVVKSTGDLSLIHI